MCSTEGLDPTLDHAASAFAHHARHHAVAHLHHRQLDPAGGQQPRHVPQRVPRLSELEETLKAGGVTPKGADIEGNNLLVRLPDATVQAKAADRYDPAMARLIDNLELLSKGRTADLNSGLCALGPGAPSASNTTEPRS